MANSNQNVGYADHEDGFRTHHRETYGDEDYTTYEPAYKHGTEHAAKEEHQDRSYEEVEPELRRSYEEKHGKGTFEQAKDAVKHAFNKVSTHIDDPSVEGSTGSSRTASGDPGSVMRNESDIDASVEQFRQHYNDTYGSTDRDFGEYKPAYRIGHKYGQKSKAENKDFEEMEEAMRKEYERTDRAATWDDVRQAANHAYTHPRSAERPSRR